AEGDQCYWPAGKTLSRECQDTRPTASGPVRKRVDFGDEGEGGGLVICFRRYLPECLLAGVVVCRLRGKLGLVWWVS
ncbi:MAG: hypothetical protein ACK6D0_20060, partial [Planctomyces sp.]